MSKVYNVYKYYSSCWDEVWYYREDKNGRLQVCMRGGRWENSDRTIDCDMLEGKVQLVAKNVRFRK